MGIETTGVITHVAKCDRCGDTETYEHDVEQSPRSPMFPAWGWLSAATNKAEHGINKTLCPQCCIELAGWVRNDAAKAVTA